MPGSASSYSVGAHSAHSYTMGEKVKVPQSTSLYSMSSGSSFASGIFFVIHMNFYANFNFFEGYSSGSATSRASTMSSHSSSVDNKLHHNHNCSTNGCTGAIPRTPSYSSFRGHKSHSFRVSLNLSYNLIIN